MKVVSLKSSKEKLYFSLFVFITILFGALLSYNNNGFLSIIHTISFSLSVTFLGFIFFMTIKLTEGN